MAKKGEEGEADQQMVRVLADPLRVLILRLRFGVVFMDGGPAAEQQPSVSARSRPRFEPWILLDH